MNHKRKPVAATAGCHPAVVRGSVRPPAACRPETVRGLAERAARRELAHLLASTGLSQERFAARLESSEDSVSRWLSGRARVPAWALLAARDLAAAPLKAVNC